MKKTVSGIIAVIAFLITCVCVFASEPVSGVKCVSSAEKEDITILFDEETKYSTKTAKWISAYIVNENGIIVYIGEKRPGEEELTYTINSGDETTRNYTVIGNVELKDGTTVNNFSNPYIFTLYTYAEKQEAMNKILNEGAAFEAYKDVLSLEFDALYKKINNRDAIVNKMKEILRGGELTHEAFLNAFDSSLVSAAISLKDAGVMEFLVNNYSEILGIDKEGKEYGWFLNDLSSEKKQKVYSYMAKRAYDTQTGALEAFKAGTFLIKLSTLHQSKVESFLRDGNGVYKEDNAVLSLDFQTFDRVIAPYSAKREYTIGLLTGKEYESLRALEAAFSDAITKGEKYTAKPQTGSPGGGGGGGGGSAGGGSSFEGIKVSTVNDPAPTQTSKEEQAFTDLGDAEWAKAEITYFAGKGWIKGVGDRRFAPNDNVTREQFAVIAAAAFELEGTETEFQFNDVEENSWYYDALKTLYSLGLIKGQGEVFGTGQNITREDMAVILYRIAEFKGISLEAVRNGEFADAWEISDYAKDAVNALYASKNIEGMGEGIFSPKSNATRAQAVKMICNITGGI